MVAVAAHDRQNQGSSDGLLLSFFELLALGLPPQFDGVLELDESSLLDLHWEVDVVHDFHHCHAETSIKMGVPVFLEPYARYSAVFLRD